MQPSFSIIIPHKNIPSLLQRCLDSIPWRDDIKVYVVDDNSDADIVDFDNFPGLDDSRCEVIFTKEGRGAGYARNVALERVKSEWVLFADCDDFFSDNLTEFLNHYKNSKAEVVFFLNDTVDCKTLEPLTLDLKVQSLLPMCEKKGNLDPLRYLSHNPWCKMVRMSLIREYNIRFQEVMASNDVWYSVMVGHYAKIVELSDLHVYIRTVRQGSLQYSLNKESLLSRIKVGYTTNNFLKSVNKIEYYNETWGYFCDLRKISWWLFLKIAPSYLIKTPWIAIKKNLKYLIKR